METKRNLRNPSSNSNSSNSAGQHAKTGSQPDIEDIKRMTQQYEGKSESELMSELFRMAKTGKENGTLDDNKLKNFERTVSPMLNDEQRKRMVQLIEMLKKE